MRPSSRSGARSACSMRSAGRRRWRRASSNVWRAGQPQLPQPATAAAAARRRRSPPSTRSCAASIAAIPIGHWLYKTAWSYRVAARMLARHRHARVHALLDAALRPARLRATAARTSPTPTPRAEMLAITDELIDPRMLPPVPCDIPAEEFAGALRERIGPFFATTRSRWCSIRTLASKADRRQQAHHPARDRAVLRARPRAAAPARGLHPHR